MKLLTVLTMASAVAAGGLVASHQLTSQDAPSDIVVYGRPAEPALIDPDRVLASLNAAAPEVEMPRSPFLDRAQASARWCELRSQAAGSTPSRSDSATRAVRRTTNNKRTAKRSPQRNNSRINPRTARRRSIFETSRSYRRNGSALERIGRYRGKRRGTQMRSSKPYRSGALERLRRRR